MSYDHGIDRYEAQSIAESAARNAADDATRSIGYDISRLQDEIRALRLELDHEREARRNATAELTASLGELWIVALKEVPA